MKRGIQLLLVLSLLLAGPVYAKINAVDNVPAATLLLPYFEVDYTSGVGPRYVVTVGNSSDQDRLAHVVLWTDRGVPTFSFDMRIVANGSVDIDLRELFVNGTLPQTTAGSFPGCAGLLPPANLVAANVTQLQRAHSGLSSTLLGGSCGGAVHDRVAARGYITIDVTSACTTKVPGDAGYFIAGGTGIATNDNVLWGEWREVATSFERAIGTSLIAIEASATAPQTEGTPYAYCSTYVWPPGPCPPASVVQVQDYTFYRRLTGTAADNREGLPQEWTGKFDISDFPNAPNAFVDAIIWRDPGKVVPFACGAPPAGLDLLEVISFDDRENPVIKASPTFPYAAQRRALAPFGFVPSTMPRGIVRYNLASSVNDADVGTRRQSVVQHIHGFASDADVASTVPGFSIAEPTTMVLAPYQPPACSDGVDNDADGKVDYPADPGCRAPESFTEATQCSDGFDNNSSGLIDTADPNCWGPADLSEMAVHICDDGIDNDGDGDIDWPADKGCSSPTSFTESSGACSDGSDNDGDGRIDYPDDPGCSSPGGLENPACSDGIDNDNDGFIDRIDPGCTSPSAGSESPACNDGLDNDGDGKTDYPNDPGCRAAWSNDERPQCDDPFDNDNDGFNNYPNDPGCAAAFDPSEFENQCSDGVDNDGDGMTDYPAETGCSTPSDLTEASDCSDGEDNDCDGVSDATDPGCANPLDLNEGAGLTRACSDGIDNDGDGRRDWPNDPGCESRWDDVEFDTFAPAVTHPEEIPALSPEMLAALGLLLAGIALVVMRGGGSAA